MKSPFQQLPPAAPPVSPCQPAPNMICFNNLPTPRRIYLNILLILVEASAVAATPAKPASFRLLIDT